MWGRLPDEVHITDDPARGTLDSTLAASADSCMAATAEPSEASAPVPIAADGAQASWFDAARSICSCDNDDVTTADVDAWLAQTTNPKREVIEAVRAVVMSDERMEEVIKYRAPAFLHGGIMAYFHWNAKEFASLVFPNGSKIPGEFERLEGDGLQRMMRFADIASVDAARDDLLDIVDLWCATR
jgi:Domain of unknown function (DU1801)